MCQYNQREDLDMKTAFEYKLDILRWELDHIQSTIRKIDDFTKDTKNWTIIVWGVSLGTAIASDSLKHCIALTALFPLLFWFVDVRFRQVQRNFIYHLNRIRDFLNSDQFDQSFEQQTLIGFVILDPMAKISRGPDFRTFVSMKRIMRWGDISWLYIGLALISLIAHMIAH